MRWPRWLVPPSRSEELFEQYYLQKVNAQRRVIEAGERLRCLNCAAPGPFARLPKTVELVSVALRDGKLVTEPTHERLSCQRCAAQFTVGPEGMFYHHEDAQPYTGERFPAPVAPKAEEPTPEARGPAPWPIAKQRPPV